MKRFIVPLLIGIFIIFGVKINFSKNLNSQPSQKIIVKPENPKIKVSKTINNTFEKKISIKPTSIDSTEAAEQNNEELTSVKDETDDSPTIDKEKSTELISEPTDEGYFPVVKVVDGDTIDIDMNGKTERLRFIGMDTPETVDPRKTVQCFGTEASNKAKELLLNKKVRLESDESQDDRDKYGRLLRYVYLEDKTFFNEWMVENGYAHEYTYIVPYKYQSEFKSAEQTARENELGLWNPLVCGTKNTPTPSPLPANSAGSSSGHVFYTSRNYTSKLYYCDTDKTWEGLSKKYLLTYTSEANLAKDYPNKTIHESCK